MSLIPLKLEANNNVRDKTRIMLAGNGYSQSGRTGGSSKQEDAARPTATAIAGLRNNLFHRERTHTSRMPYYHPAAHTAILLEGREALDQEQFRNKE